MKRLAILLMVAGAAACSDDPTSPVVTIGTGIEVENRTGQRLEVFAETCGTDPDIVVFKIADEQSYAWPAAAGCWRLDGSTGTRYAFIELELAAGTVTRVIFRSADSDDPHREIRLITIVTP